MTFETPAGVTALQLLEQAVACEERADNLLEVTELLADEVDDEVEEWMMLEECLRAGESLFQEALEAEAKEK